MRSELYWAFFLFVPAVLAQQLYPTPRPPGGQLVFGNCSVLMDNDPILGNYVHFSDQGLLPSLFIGGDGNSPPFLRIVRSKVTCLNSGLIRGTASSVGMLVEYQRQTDPAVFVMAQVAVDCIEDPHNSNSDFSFYPTPASMASGTALNTARVSLGNTLQDNVNVNFSTGLRTNCAICSDLSGGLGDPVTRCVGCIDCNNGSARCVGNSQATDQCCAYYLDNLCVQFCPEPLVANEATFDCGCAALDVPNGGVNYTNAQLVGSVATYSCDTVNGYILPDDGGTTRTCTLSGWTGSDLTCELHDCKMTNLFNPQNGEFKLESGLTTFGAVATFECLTGYDLVGVSSRTCTLTGWSGTNPTCDVKVQECPECNTGECDTSTGECVCPAGKTGENCLDNTDEEASTGAGCGTPCIIGIVLAVVGAIILVAVVAAVAYGIFSYLNHPDTKMAKFDNENFNGVARDNPLYVDPEAVVGDGAEAA